MLRRNWELGLSGKLANEAILCNKQWQASFGSYQITDGSAERNLWLRLEGLMLCSIDDIYAYIFDVSFCTIIIMIDEFFPPENSHKRMNDNR